MYVDVINTLRLNSDTTDAFVKAREIALGSGIMRELKEGKSPRRSAVMKTLKSC